MIDCNRPGANASPFQFTNFQVRNMTFTGVGTAVNASFPFVRRVATINFESPARLISITMASSIVETSALATAGFFVAIDRGEFLSLAGPGSFDVFLSHICRQNSVAGIPSSSSRSNAMVMGEGSAYLLQSGSVLALYASAENSASDELSAIVSAYWTPQS